MPSTNVFLELHIKITLLRSIPKKILTVCTAVYFQLCIDLIHITPQDPFPKRQILDSSNLKESADDNFEFDETGRKFSKRVENTVGKGEIARYEQFLLFPQCFQKSCTADA